MMQNLSHLSLHGCLCVYVWGGYLRAYDEQNEELLCFKIYVVKIQGHFELKKTTFRSGMDQ